jgi:hypothetical protein
MSPGFVVIPSSGGHGRVGAEVRQPGRSSALPRSYAGSLHSLDGRRDLAPFLSHSYMSAAQGPA